MVNSGSSANLLTFEVLNILENSEIITPVLTFATTLSPIIKKGLIPVFVDVEKETYNIDPEKIENHISKNTKVILPVHFGGLSCDLNKIHSIAKKYNLKIQFLLYIF